MSTSLQDLSGNTVLADATSKGLLVQNPKVMAQAGFAGVVAIRDQGTITGTPNVASIDVTSNGRLRVGLDTPLFQDQFNYTAQNTSVWNYVSSTMTVTWSTGYAAINAGNDVTSGHYTVLKTYRTFPLYTAGELLFDCRGYFTESPQANNNFVMGFGIPGTTALPTDGCYFHVDASGALTGVSNWNGTTIVTAAFAFPSLNTTHEWLIVTDDSIVEFWIDHVLQATLVQSAGADTPSSASAAQVFYQMYNSGTVPLAQQFHLQNLQMSITGLETSKPWPHIKAGEGLMSLQGQAGGTMGSTALYANSAAPTAAVPTNTTAALGVGLGGNFYETATLAVTTDGIISSFQVPLGSVTQSPRNLYITGIRWYSAVSTLLAGGPFVVECGLAFGGTALSLATAESGSVKAYRRFPIGLYTLAATAPVGTIGASFVHEFATPILVQPGEYVATIVRNIGTVGTAGVIAHHIGIEGYYE